ncbi:hypothetical protein O181_001280 [Austropuccinia psidii MF-1]|uniref:Uncharacterized protein n=1 Tax=Austropuccinia psidii MF-1 TaxID=1389203 RepID=A0A9Q3BAP2_9BASI|nr:hypothetical protein [Austropuccinia psidii MF-1]
MSQPWERTPPLGAYGNSNLNKFMANWPSWPSLHLIRPQVNPTQLGPGGFLTPLTISRASGPPPLIRGFWPKWPFWAFRAPMASGPPPLIRGFWPKWPFWAFRAPMASMTKQALVHRPCTMGPFRPKSNEAKRDKRPEIWPPMPGGSTNPKGPD